MCRSRGAGAVELSALKKNISQVTSFMQELVLFLGASLLAAVIHVQSNK